jgi:hypothetical protein
MRHVKADRPVNLIIAGVLGAALLGSNLLSPVATSVAQAQSEPVTAANGVLLPPLNFDPVAARNEGVNTGVIVPATPSPAVSPTDGTTVTDAPDANTAATEGTADAPENGSSVTTSLGGSDVAVSSVGGSYEVDGPNKRSRRN